MLLCLPYFSRLCLSRHELLKIRETFRADSLTCQQLSSTLVLACWLLSIDNFPYKLIFVLDKSRPKKLHSRKQPLKSSKIPKFGREMLYCVENIALQSLQIFSLLCYARKSLSVLSALKNGRQFLPVTQ